MPPVTPVAFETDARAVGPMADDILGRNFRAGEGYELVVYDRLTPDERNLVAELGKQADFYGIFRPSGDRGRTIKVVGKDTALLWLTLKVPGSLPFFVRHGDLHEALAEITTLVLDGVLEIEDDGHYISGPQASALLRQRRGSRSRHAPGTLAMLSTAALRYGEALRLDESEQLAGRLYAYGRQPISPWWQRRLMDPDAVLTFVGAGAGTTLRRQLNAIFRETDRGRSPSWLQWFSRMPSNNGEGGTHYKLYVSPSIEAMPRVFPMVVEVAAKASLKFKIGCDAGGLLRPDKIVLYLRDQETLFDVAAKLAAYLRDVPAHGVPFSAEISPDGLLSWGMDPPSTDRVLSWQHVESWRLWVVRRLAAAMIAAQKDHSNTSPTAFALERLRCEGVDVERWVPSVSNWSHVPMSF